METSVVLVDDPAPQIRRIVGHRHHVAEARWDVAVTAGAQIRLGGLIGLDEAGLDRIVMPEVGVHGSAHQGPQNEPDEHGDAHTHIPVVERAAMMLSGGIQTHTSPSVPCMHGLHLGRRALPVALMVAGLTLGCFNAWHWVAKEDRAMREEQEDGDE